MRRSNQALLYMTKWPESGRAKTRLSPPLTLEEAARLARCFLLDTLDAARVADADRYLAFAPMDAREPFRALVGPDVGLIPAEGAHLGVSLHEAMRAAFALGYARAAVVASDVPHLPPTRYADAFAALNSADVAIGPSADGGYYLLATARPIPRLFEGIAWSTETVCTTTLARAAELSLRVAVLPSCDDVDTAADLPRLHAALRGQPHGARTRAALVALERGDTAWDAAAS